MSSDTFSYRPKPLINPFLEVPSGSNWAYAELSWLNVDLEAELPLIQILPWVPSTSGKCIQEAETHLGWSTSQVKQEGLRRNDGSFYYALCRLITPFREPAPHIPSSSIRSSSPLSPSRYSFPLFPTTSNVRNPERLFSPEESPRPTYDHSPARSSSTYVTAVESHLPISPAQSSSTYVTAIEGDVSRTPQTSTKHATKRQSNTPTQAVNSNNSMRRPETPKAQSVMSPLLGHSGGQQGASRSSMKSPLGKTSTTSSRHVQQHSDGISVPRGSSDTGIDSDFNPPWDAPGSSHGSSAFASDDDDDNGANDDKLELDVEYACSAFLFSLQDILEMSMATTAGLSRLGKFSWKGHGEFSIVIDGVLMKTAPDILWRHEQQDKIDVVMFETKLRRAKSLQRHNVLGQEVCHMLAYLCKREYERNSKVHHPYSYLVSWHFTTGYISSLEISESQVNQLQDSAYLQGRIRVRRSREYNLLDPIQRVEFAGGVIGVLLATLDVFKRHRKLVRDMKRTCDA